MDSESECDWNPPEEEYVVEQEIYEVPSGLPSLEDFIELELEREVALEKDEEKFERDVDAENELETAKDKEEKDLLPPEADALDDGLNVEALSDPAPSTLGDDQTEDEDETPLVKPKKIQKPSTPGTDDIFGLDIIKIGFSQMQEKANSQDEEELRLRLETSTNAFIDNLVGKVVDACEYEDPDDILRARLDKNKICSELDEKMFELDVEQKVRFFLNRKTVEYFRRKKSTRPLIDDNPDQVLTQLRKYREALTMLNQNKGLEESTRSLLQTKTVDLGKQVLELENQSKEKNIEFEEMVKKVLCEDSSEKMEALIENFTKRMRNMQKEISKVRFVLIQRQHTMALLQDRARKLEDLGNGLRMLDFEHLQTETQAQGKKIEERNNELSRLHSRFNADIHTIAHIREKQSMTRNTISAQQEVLDELIEEKQNCREYLNELKIERGSKRRDFQKLSFQSGLLDKPELLLDFDATEAKVNALQEKIDEMKAKQEVVDEKLKHIMNML